MRTILAFAALAALSSEAMAQQQRTYSVAVHEAQCRRMSMGNPDNCARVSDHVRKRYGNEATIYQWNAAVGVIRNQLRQGK